MNKAEIHIGSATERLAALPAQSVHCIVTSPPYWGLRTYKGDSGMIGLEPTWNDHVNNLLSLFEECRRALRDDGTLWLNYGDAYWSNPGNGRGKAKQADGGKPHHSGAPRTGKAFRPKQLMMMPARLAIAMQDAGWILRSEIIWHKPNPMPESATDRPTCGHEKLFLFSKQPRYFYDSVAVRTGLSESTVERFGPTGNPNGRNGQFEDGTKPDTVFSGKRPKWVGPNPDRNDGGRGHVAPEGSANLRNVWKIPTQGYKGAHFATFPPALVEPCIKAGTSETGCCAECGAPWVRVVEKSGGRTGQSWHDHDDDLGRGQRGAVSAPGYKVETRGWQAGCDCDAAIVPCTVLDPFGGAGTTALAANRLQRDAVLIEISPEYAEMARQRLADDGGFLVDVRVVD